MTIPVSRSELAKVAVAAPDGIEYRRGTPEDALCVSVLAMQVFLDTYASGGVRPDLAREALSVYAPENFARHLAHPSACFILAERLGHLVAFAELALDAVPPQPSLERGAELVRLYVQSPFKRMGLGKVLLAQAEAVAAARSATILWLTAWTGNQPALAFYAAQGYTDVGATQYVFEGKSYENRIFRKALAGVADAASPSTVVTNRQENPR